MDTDTACDHLGLCRQPFDIHGDGDVVLATDPLSQAMDTIQSAIISGTAQIRVSGASGSGKTSLGRALREALSRSGDVAGVARVGDLSRDWAAVRADIARQLQMPRGELCRDALVAGRGHRRRWVLIVDEADRLTAEAAEHLDSLLDQADASGRVLFSIIALAQERESGAATSVLDRWLDPTRTLRVRLAPLSARALHGYIEKRLQVAGRRGARLFSPGAALEVYRATRGNPRAVNALCRSLLEEAGRRGLSQVGADLVRAAAGGAPRAAAVMTSGPESGAPFPQSGPLVAAASVGLAAESAPSFPRSSDTWSTLWAMALVALLALAGFAATPPPIFP